MQGAQGCSQEPGVTQESTVKCSELVLDMVVVRFALYKHWCLWSGPHLHVKDGNRASWSLIGKALSPFKLYLMEHG